MVKIFEDLDADKSGELTFEELLDAPQEVKDEMNACVPDSLEDSASMEACKSGAKTALARTRAMDIELQVRANLNSESR